MKHTQTRMNDRQVRFYSSKTLSKPFAVNLLDTPTGLLFITRPLRSPSVTSLLVFPSFYFIVTT